MSHPAASADSNLANSGTLGAAKGAEPALGRMVVLTEGAQVPSDGPSELARRLLTRRSSGPLSAIAEPVLSSAKKRMVKRVISEVSSSARNAKEFWGMAFSSMDVDLRPNFNKPEDHIGQKVSFTGMLVQSEEIPIGNSSIFKSLVVPLFPEQNIAFTAVVMAFNGTNIPIGAPVDVVGEVAGPVLYEDITGKLWKCPLVISAVLLKGGQFKEIVDKANEGQNEP